MTAAILAAQGPGVTDRRRTCARASTEGKGVTRRTTRKISHRGAPVGAPTTQDLRSPVRDLDVTMADGSATIYASLAQVRATTASR